MNLSLLLFSIGLLQAPKVTTGHRCIGLAAVLGLLFVITHVVTIIVTCLVEGLNWGAAAWSADLSGFLAGGLFALLCWQSSNKRSAEFRLNNRWILMWAAITASVRVFDTLMLFGVVKFDAVYITPTGAVLASNIISEVLIGNAYTMTALVGSLMLLYCPKDVEVRDINQSSITTDLNDVGVNS